MPCKVPFHYIKVIIVILYLSHVNIFGLPVTTVKVFYIKFMLSQKCHVSNRTHVFFSICLIKNHFNKATTPTEYAVCVLDLIHYEIIVRESVGGESPAVGIASCSPLWPSPTCVLLRDFFRWKADGIGIKPFHHMCSSFNKLVYFCMYNIF